MGNPYRVRVISSYIYRKDDLPHAHMGRENRWFHGFVKSLVLQGSGLAAFDVKFDRLPGDMDEVRAFSKKFDDEGVQLVICPGSDAAVRWARVNRTIPTLYFGAHAENNGLELIEQENISGIRLNLPLIWKYKNFSILKELLPDLEKIYIPLNYWSEFNFPNVRANYNLFRRKKNGFWIPGESTHHGNRSVHFLAERLGCESHEGPYADLEELERGLAEIEPGVMSALVCFNDSLLMEGTVELYLKNAKERRLPLFWVNNFPIIKAGGVADFSSDFQAVGELLARMALRLLRDGVPVNEIEYEADPGETFGLNLPRCRELGIDVSPATRARFQLVAE